MTAVGIDFETAQGAILDWVQAKSGLPDGRAYWADQDNPRAVTAPYVVLKMMGLRSLGRDGVTHTEELSGSVTTSTRGPRVIRLALTSYSDDARHSQPMAILDRIIAGAEDIAVIEAMKAAGVAVGEVGDITPIPGIEAFTIRATVQLDIHTRSELAGTGYVFRTAVVSSDDLDVSATAPRTPP